MFFFFFQAEDGIRDWSVTGVQTCALPICSAQSKVHRGHLPVPGEGRASEEEGQAMKFATISAIALLAVGCSADPPKQAPPPKKAPAVAPRPAAAAGTPSELTSNAPDIRKKALKDEDFVESSTNRDPFHSFILDLISGPV